MFSQIFSLFWLKRKHSSIEETTTDIDESNGRPTKRVRIVEPSSNEEELLQTTPVQAVCTIRNEDEEEEWEVLNEILPQGMKVAEAERMENEVEALAARLRQETRIFAFSAPLPPLQEFVLGSTLSTSPPPALVPIFVSQSRRSPVSEDSIPIPPLSPRRLPISIDFTSSPTIRASLHRIRQHYDGTSAHPSEVDVDRGDGADNDGSESGDEDLLLFTEMMKPWKPASELPPSREYPVYAEELDLPGPPVDTQVIIFEDFGSASRPARPGEEEDEESPEERLLRLVREGEAED